MKGKYNFINGIILVFLLNVLVQHSVLAQNGITISTFPFIGDPVTYSIIPTGCNNTQWSVTGTSHVILEQQINSITVVWTAYGIGTVSVSRWCGSGGAWDNYSVSSNIGMNAPEGWQVGNSCSSISFMWGRIYDATGYYLDVAKDINFSDIIPGYNNLHIGNVTSYEVNSGLISASKYYVRVRAYNAYGPGVYSNPITCYTEMNPVTVYSVTGGGNYCSGGSAVPIGLSGSQVDFNYRLFRDNTTLVTSVYGTGNTITFGNFTTPGSYTVTGTDWGNCSKSMSGSAIVTINPIPNTLTAPPVSLCGPGAATLIANSGTYLSLMAMVAPVITARWYTTSTGGSPVHTGASYITPVLSATTSYWMSTFNTTTNCESERIEVPVTINPIPGTPSVFPVSRCGPGIVTLTSTVGAGLSARWYTTSTDGTLIHTGVSYTTPVLSASTSYWVSTFNSTTTCESGRIEVPVTINPIPGAPTVSPVSRCEPGTVTLIASVGAGLNARWYTSSTGGSPVHTGASYTTPVLSTNTSYWVASYNTITSCVSSRIEAPVTIYPTLNPGIIAGNQTLCSSGDVTAFTNTASATGGNGSYNYQWQMRPLNGSWSDIAEATSAIYDHGILTSTTEFRRAVTSCDQMLYSNTLTVTVFNAEDNVPKLTFSSDIHRISLSTNSNWKNAMLYKDTRPGYEHLADVNYNNFPMFSAWAWTQDNIPTFRRSTIRIALNELPPMASILSAMLSLRSDPVYLHAGRNNGANAMFFEKIIVPWDETTVNWNNQPASTIDGRILIGTSTSELEDRTIDITTFVQDWVLEPASNFGMKMFLENEVHYTSRNYVSIFNPNTDLHPKLEIAYIARCGPGVVTLGMEPGSNADNIKWYTSPTAGSLLHVGSNFVTPHLNSTTTYYVSSYNSINGCESARIPITVFVYPLPEPPITSEDPIVRCGSGIVELNAEPGSGGDVIKWYLLEDDIEETFTGNTFITPVIEEHSVFYATSVNSSTGCESEKKPIYADVLSETPPIPGHASRYGPGKVQLTATSDNLEGIIVRWYSSMANGELLGTGTSFQTPYITQSTTYFASVYNESTDCESEGSAVIATIHPPVTPNYYVLIEGASTVNRTDQITYVAKFYDLNNNPITPPLGESSWLINGSTAYDEVVETRVYEMIIKWNVIGNHLLAFEYFTPNGELGDIKVELNVTVSHQIPVILPATNITDNSFTANWENIDEANAYLLDVSADPDFTEFIPGFNDLEVTSNSWEVIGLSDYGILYYRVRALYDGITSNYSAFMPVSINVKVLWAISDGTWNNGLNWSHQENGPPIHVFPTASSTVYIKGYHIEVTDTHFAENLNIIVKDNDSSLKIGESGQLELSGELYIKKGNEETE